MYIVGDAHARVKEYIKLIETINEPTIQVGDLGIGFIQIPFEKIPLNHKFIRGNHDNPKLCKKIPNFLGEYGITNNIFFISGADSIDKEYRTIGIDWWKDEELSTRDMMNLIIRYSSLKPKYVVSHDCPRSFSEKFFGGTFNSKTSNMMNKLLEIHQPEIWVFGHHHRSVVEEFNKTKFIGLSELETYKLY